MIEKATEGKREEVVVMEVLKHHQYVMFEMENSYVKGC